MSNKNTKNIDAAFRKQLLEALELVYEEQVRKATTKDEKFRADFLHIWHHEWIVQDLSVINPTVRRA